MNPGDHGVGPNSFAVFEVTVASASFGAGPPADGVVAAGAVVCAAFGAATAPVAAGLLSDFTTAPMSCPAPARSFATSVPSPAI